MRTRIGRRLETAARYPVTLIVAPAGFGKSVALRDFIERSAPDAVRYNVRREDGTLLAFVRSLSEALKETAPGALAAFPAMQQSILAAEEPVRQLSDWFVEHLGQTACTIAIDDLHFAAADPASIALVADLIERTSDRIRWIIAARSDLGLPVATWIAYGRMDIPLGEDELRFTTDEALDAAGETRSEIQPQEVEALRQLTEGWPVALTIALRTRTHAQDLRTASLGTREMVYRYLAEQVYAALSPQQREFALASSVFSTFDTAIAQELGASPESLAQTRAKLAFLNETAPGEFRYHDLFRDFLEAELRRTGEDVWTQALRRGAALLERRGADASALQLYARARAYEEILRIVERAGFNLFERGESGALATALAALPEDVRASNPAALGLHAMLEAGRGHFEVAEPDFRAAIEAAADGRLRAALVLRYAIELVRHGRDCIPLLEQAAGGDAVPPKDRAALLGTLATGYANAGRHGDAARAITRALEEGANSSEEVRARLYHQAAYVFQFSDPEQTQRYETLAVDAALSQNLFELAARAYSGLYQLRYEADDAAGSLAILERIGECARKGGSNQARLFALIASYEIEAERGNEPALEQLNHALQQISPTFTPARSEALLPALALQAAWDGDFKRAYQLRVQTAREQSSDERRALRSAETAFYAIAGGAQERGEEAYREAASALERSRTPSLRTMLARIFLSLCDLSRGHHSSAHRLLAEAEEGSASWPRVRAFAHAVRVLYRLHLGQAEPEAFEGALERMRQTQFAGMARMLAALPSPAAKGAGYLQLTPAEREIIQFLATGASTKDIANKTGRSAHTVDTHIRAICRKLQCSGRREAVALAISAGWVHA